MNEEYEIIFITEEGRAIKNNKTGKIYHSEFEIIEEKNKEINRLNNLITELEKWIEEHKQYQLISERYIVWEDKLVNKLKALKENK